MDSTTKNLFVEKFNPMEKTHVMWLKKMGQMMETLDPTRQMDLSKLVNLNPMGVQMNNPLDWVFIHFSLAMKYTNAVLGSSAWTPMAEAPRAGGP